MKRLLAIGTLVALTLGVSACGGGKPSGTVSSSRLVTDGHIRITINVAKPAHAGRPLGASFTVENVSKQPRTIQLDYPTSLWLVLHAADGTTFDTRKVFMGTGGGPRRPTTLRPGATVTRQFRSPYIRWSGPLRIVAGWDQSPLPALRVDVTSPGPPPDDRTAIADVVESTGHLLDNCRPVSPGVAVIGRIDAPENSAPPLRTKCSISLRHDHGFDVAQVLILSPPDLRGIRVSEPYETLPWFKGAGNTKTNAEAIAWTFVVTRDGATSVNSTSVESAKSGSPRMAPDWEWTSAGHGARPGGSRCGHTGGGGGGYSGPEVEFVSICR